MQVSWSGAGPSSKRWESWASVALQEGPEAAAPPERLLTVTMLGALIDANPKCVSLADAAGRLPVHLVESGAALGKTETLSRFGRPQTIFLKQASPFPETGRMDLVKRSLAAGLVWCGGLGTKPGPPDDIPPEPGFEHSPSPRDMLTFTEPEPAAGAEVQAKAEAAGPIHVLLSGGKGPGGGGGGGGGGISLQSMAAHESHRCATHLHGLP